MEITYSVNAVPGGSEISWLSPTFGKRVTLNVSKEQMTLAVQGGQIGAGQEDQVLQALAAGVDTHHLENTHVLQRHDKAIVLFRDDRPELKAALLRPWVKAEPA
jgi:hypothetical protein